MGHLGTLDQDVLVLQETHFRDERDRSQAQRVWTFGPSFWSYDPDPSAGIGVLFRSRPDLRVDARVDAVPGRLLVVDFTIHDRGARKGEGAHAFRLIALYAPGQNKPKKSFWTMMRAYTSTVRQLIVIGDFNNRTRPEDRTGVAMGEKSRVVSRSLTGEEEYLQKMLTSLNLEDKALGVDNRLEYFPLPFRKQFLDNYKPLKGVRFTYYHPTYASRIDRMWAPRGLEAEGCKIILTPYSDHAIVGFSCLLGRAPPRGKPGWRMNGSDLDKEPFVLWVESTIGESLIYKRCARPDPLAWWERTKKRIKSRARGSEGRADRKEIGEYHRAVYNYLLCHYRTNKGLPVDGSVLDRARAVMDAFQARKRDKTKKYKRFRTKGAVVDIDDWAKSKVKSTPVSFVELRARKEDGATSEPQGMLKIMQEYYRKVYAQKVISEEEMEEYLNSDGGVGRKIDPDGEEARELAAPFTEQEIRDAVRDGKPNAAPGPDGLPHKFYKCFGGALNGILTELFNEMWDSGRISPSFAQGTLIFFPKKGDLTLPENWRPIALTNADYRILARVLNNRLKKLAHRLVAKTQTSSVPGRAMTDSLKLFREIFRRCRDEAWSGSLVQLDQVKAFDNLSHRYLWRVLEHKGVPRRFVDLLKLLYRDAEVFPQVNGWRGEGVVLRSGVKQGCPLSPLLYVLALDPVLEKIEKDRRLAGIALRCSFLQTEGDRPLRRRIEGLVKLVAHADDVTVLVGDEKEKDGALRHFERFGRATGASLNLKKSFAYGLKGKGEKIEEIGLDEAKEDEGRKDETRELQRVKLLGIYYSLRDSGQDYNWEVWAEAVEEKTKKWARWGLTMYQKAVYVRTYTLPMVGNLAAVYPAPATVIARANGAIFKFLWGTKSFPAPRILASATVGHGGLDLPALGPLFLATFLADNFLPWGAVERPGDRASGSEADRVEKDHPAWLVGLGARWRNSQWAEKWWKEGTLDYRITREFKDSGPDYMGDLYAQVKEWKADPSFLKDGNSADLTNLRQAIRDQKKRMYRGMVDEAQKARVERKKGRKGEQACAYLTVPPGEVDTFSDKRVPYSLWEVRWRVYHQVLNIGASRPWLPIEKQICPRLCCRRGSGEGAAPRETHEHFLKGCPAAAELWRNLGNRLEWPTLEGIAWETVASGLEPDPPLRGPIKSSKVREGQAYFQYWTVPWSTVRLLLLVAVAGMVEDRDWESRHKQPTDSARRAEGVVRRFLELAEVEKGRTKSHRWKKLWPWLEGSAFGVT